MNNDKIKCEKCDVEIKKFYFFSFKRICSFCYISQVHWAYINKFISLEQYSEYRLSKPLPK